MTSETRIFIEPQDIAGIEIECPKCHLSILYPIAGDKTVEILAGCPHCCHYFFDEKTNPRPQQAEFPAINELQRMAASLRSLRRQDRTDIHAHIRFRVNVDAG